MSSHDATVPLRQMLDHGRRAVGLIAGKKQQQVEQDEVLFLALTRLLEILGEAAGRVPENVRNRHPRIPWRSVVGLRNVLIHGYDTIDPEIVWRILTEDLPAMLPHLEAATAEEMERKNDGNDAAG